MAPHNLIVVLFAALVVVPGSIGAQIPEQVAELGINPGDRVRLLETGHQVPQEATLVSFHRDTLVVQRGSASRDSIPIASLASLYVSRGISTDAGRVFGGMTWGLLAGVGAGWFVGKVGCSAFGAAGTCGLGVGKWMTILGAGGLVAGALWGLESREEEWDRVYPPMGASLQVTPGQHHDVLVGVSLPLVFGYSAPRPGK